MRGSAERFSGWRVHDRYIEGHSRPNLLRPGISAFKLPACDIVTRAMIDGVPANAAYAYTAFSVVVTFHAVCFAWCFFRLTDFDDALACVRKLAVFDPDKALAGGAADFKLWLLLAAYAIATAAAVVISRGAPVSSVGQQLRSLPMLRGFYWGIAFGMLVLALTLAPGSQNSPFIYFRF
jgi:hypothetical protein